MLSHVGPHTTSPKDATTKRFRASNVHQGQRIGATYYNDKLQYLQALIQHIRALKDRSYIVIVGGDINIMPTEDDLYNPLHSEWNIMAMISVPERNLFNEILRLGFHDVVAERLPHRPYTREFIKDTPRTAQA